MLSLKTTPPEFLTSHIRDIQKTDPNPEYTFDYVGSKLNVRSLMETLSPHLLHKGGYSLGERVIVEHTKILFSHIEITKLLKQFSEDSNESLLLCGSASLLLAGGADPVCRPFCLNGDYQIKEIELKGRSLPDESARCYQLAIKYFEKFEAIHIASPCWDGNYIRPSSVAKNHLISLVAGSPEWALSQKDKTLLEYFEKFEDPIREGYWPTALNILNLTQNFHIPLSPEDNDSGFLISICSLKAHLPDRLEEKDSSQLLAIWKRVRESAFSSQRGLKRKAYGPSISEDSLSKRKVNVNEREKKIAELQHTINNLQIDNRQLLKLCDKLSSVLEELNNNGRS